MHTFLSVFKRSIQLKSILGVCPFVVDTRQQCVRLSAYSTVYTIIYISLLFIIYPPWLYTTLRQFEGVVRASSTRNLTASLDHLAIATVYFAMLAMSLKNRRRHAALLNALNTVHGRIQSAVRYSTYRRLHVRNMCFTAVYLACPVLNGIFHDQYGLDVKAFYMLFSLVITSVLVAMLHIQDIAIVLCDGIDCCLRGLAGDQAIDGMSADSMFVLSDLYDLQSEFGRCFGSQLLLNTVKDLFMVTIMLYYVIANLVFDIESSVYENAYLLAVFVVPVVAKNGLLIVVIDRLENQVNICLTIVLL